MQELKRIEQDVVGRIAQAQSTSELNAVRSDSLGKRGPVALALKGLGKLDADARRSAGEAINAVKASLLAAFAEAEARLSAQDAQAAAQKARVDVTLPGRRTISGAPHPLRLVEARVLEVLATLGFRLAEGPLVEHDWYNFEALNIPEEHPARDMQDTFFVADRLVLRTHTSNVQVRTMAARTPPVRIVAPGMVFRNDQVDATHSPAFHQLEGLWIDERVTFADLKGVLRTVLLHLFGADAAPRFRPSYFPFTEPSAEVDVSCVACSAHNRSLCRVCKGTGYVEILGAGMVDPNVLAAVGYDPERVQGFAFGMGLERIAMLSYGIDDIRLLYENDQRFLDQFAPRGGLLRAKER
jgi:phenylalanyl-tRNA synthetase alpha chain